MRRQRLQRRQVEDHEEAGFLPHRHDHQAIERGVLAAEPVARGHAEQAEDLVDQAVGRRIEEQPDVRDRDHGQHGRGEERQTQERLAQDLAVDPHGHQQRERDRRRNGAEREQQVVAEHPPEDRVLEHQRVVLEPDERRRPAALRRRVETADQGRDRRIVRERHQEHGRRQHHQPPMDGAQLHVASPEGLAAKARRCKAGNVTARLPLPPPSSPRKRGSRSRWCGAAARGPWMPAFAGMTEEEGRPSLRLCVFVANAAPTACTTAAGGRIRAGRLSSPGRPAWCRSARPAGRRSAPW